MSSPRNTHRLNSWKAIANYIKKSERTARRWEREEGMPVHRQMHQSLASVYAYASEIDEWLSRGEDSAGSDTPTTLQPPGPEQASIAVLPFDFVGPDSNDAYIADGFTDEIIADLSKLESLRVISRTSSMQLRNTGLDIVEIAKRLSVSYLLEGSVRLLAGNIRIGVRLLDPAQNRQVWAEKYAGRVDEVFAIQERIAREVAAAMSLHLSSEEKQRLTEREITDWSSWLTVVQAREQSSRWTRAGIDQAVELLQTAVRHHRNTGYLHAALGKAYLQYREAGLDMSERTFDKAERCAEEAKAADPNGPDTFQLLGWLSYSRGEIQEAVRYLKEALTRRWSDPESLGLLCNCYLISGKVNEARALIPQAMALDPLSPLNKILPAWADMLEGRHADAVNTYRSMLENQPQSLLGRLFYVLVLAVSGRGEEARCVAEGYAPADADSLSAAVANSLARGCRGEVPSIKLTADDRKMVDANDMYPRMLAQAYAMAGDIDTSLQWLSRAISKGFINFPYLNEYDPVLTSLKKDKRYLKLLAGVEQRWLAFRP